LNAPKKTVAINYPPKSCPETVQEMIDLLALFPLDYKIEFNGITLYRLKDRGGFVNFEFNELDGNGNRVD
jgi:hypothetical protein